MKQGLNANTLKVIAITAMTIDHIAWMLFPGYAAAPLPVFLHILGRLTCPIMCFFIAEGYHHTQNIRKYTFRLFLFAFLSHFAYVFASQSFSGWTSFIPFYNGEILNQTSVMWPLAWGLVMLRIADSSSIAPKVKPLLIVLICLITFPSDWSCIASLCVLAFGTNRHHFKAQSLWMVFYVSLYAVVYFFALDRLYGLIQMAVVFAIPLLYMYNGQKGGNIKSNPITKWFFYIYYPLHMFLIGWLQSSYFS